MTNVDLNMDALLAKLNKQAQERVDKELATERESRVKKYMATAIKSLVKGGVFSPEEAAASAKKYKIVPSAILPRPEPRQYDDGCGSTTTNSGCGSSSTGKKPAPSYSSGGCGSTSPSSSNRC